MERFTKTFSEARGEIFHLEIFQITINSLIFLLAAILSLQFFQLSWVYAIFPPLFYVNTKIAKRKSDKRIIERVSQEYPTWEEKLKTAYDNQEDKENEIVTKLLKEVIKGIENMRTSHFLNNRKIFKKLSLCIALIFMLLSLIFFNLSIYSLSLDYDSLDLLKEINSQTGGFLPLKLTSEIGTNSKRWEASNYSTEEEKKIVGGGGSGGKIPGFSKGPIPGSGGGAGTKPGEDIWGSPSAVEISGEEIEMEMHPEYGGEIEIKEERTKKSEGKFSLAEARGAETPGKDPVKYEELIKRYFEKLLEEENKR